MKTQLKALGRVTGMVALATAVVVLVRLVLTNINPETIPYVVGAVMLGFAFYTLYSIALAQVKYEEKLKELAKK